MSTDNPFDAPDHQEESPAGDFGDREPARLSIGSVLERSWVLVTEQPAAIILTLLILLGVGIIFAIPGGVIQFFEQQQPDFKSQLPFTATRLGLQLIGGLVSLFFTLGAIRVFAEIAGGNEGRVSMVFSEGGSYLSAVAAYILLFFITLIGFLLFIVPGIILSVGLQFVFYVIVHERRGPIDALARSWELTDGYKMDLFIISLVLMVGVIAILCGTCGVGLFVVWPILAVVQAVLYHSLLHLNSDAEALRNEG